MPRFYIILPIRNLAMCRCKEMWLWKVAKKRTHSILSTEEKVRVKFARMYGVSALDFA